MVLHDKRIPFYTCVSGGDYHKRSRLGVWVSNDTVGANNYIRTSVI